MENRERLCEQRKTGNMTGRSRQRRDGEGRVGRSKGGAAKLTAAMADV